MVQFFPYHSLNIKVIKSFIMFGLKNVKVVIKKVN